MPKRKQLEVLGSRPQFLAVAQNAKKWVAPGLIMQLGPHQESQTVARYGLTATTKIGNAVIRNRARRRMRALALDILAAHAKTGHDYVLIARPTTSTRDYQELKADLVTALKKLGVYRE